MIQRNELIEQLSLYLPLNFNTKFISKTFAQEDMAPLTKPLTQIAALC